MTVFDDAAARARRFSPHLRALIDRHPDIVSEPIECRALASEPIDPERPIASALRIAKQRTALRLAIADLAGVASLETVTAGLSAFADRALDAAIATAVDERTPGEDPRGFAVLALGKHGSGELNYSSDIDPILVYDPTTLPRRAREEPADAAVRIARRVVELMQARDGDGYVFRIDLRLRPASEVTPIAIPVDAAIGHYESSALGWERAAFIRARAAAGDVALGRRFLAAIRPFLWRIALDFGAVAEIRALTARIRSAHDRLPFGPGFDLKRGRGGIREIEFFAQIHQLIHGGRDPAVRAPATLDALDALSGAGLIDPEAAAELGDAYRLFRTIEHRLQMVDDRQTHSLPDGEALDGVAGLHGLADGAALVALLAPHVERVGRRYDALDAGHRDALPGRAEALADDLARRGFPDGARAAKLTARWRAGDPRALRSSAAREALEAVLPAFVDAIAAAPDPDAALLHADRMIDRLPSAVNIFRLLEARPALLALVAAILSHAPVLADLLGRRPALLDGLIDASALDPPPSVAALLDAFAPAARDEPLEALLDRVRRQVGERRFALGVQIVAGAADPLDVAAGSSRVAEAALGVLADAVVADHERQHGRIDGAELVVLALGRFGGEALTHASDLDLVFLFTGDIGRDSDGPRPLDTTRYFNRLAQRAVGALSVATAAGPLYAVDTRLRPSGAQGLLAVSVESFGRYQAEAAWTWEAMALARARPVYGSPGAKASAEAVIEAALRAPRDLGKLTADVRSMRAEITLHKPPAGPFDVKLGPGGLVDLEFVVHHAQLAHGAGLTPRLGEAAAALAAEALVPAALPAAHDMLTRMLVLLRLVEADGEPLAPATRGLVASACGAADWDALLAMHAAARQTVRDAFAALGGEAA